MKEEWRFIEGFSKYLISSLGNIISLNYHSTGRSEFRKPYYRNGYLHIELSKNNKSYKFSIARLVAKTFIPNPENKPCVNHKDTNRLNNNINNLEWVTHSENTQHAWDSGCCEVQREKAKHNFKMWGLRNAERSRQFMKDLNFKRYNS